MVLGVYNIYRTPELDAVDGAKQQKLIKDSPYRLQTTITETINISTTGLEAKDVCLCVCVWVDVD